MYTTAHETTTENGNVKLVKNWDQYMQVSYTIEVYESGKKCPVSSTVENNNVMTVIHDYIEKFGCTAQLSEIVTACIEA